MHCRFSTYYSLFIEECNRSSKAIVFPFLSVFLKTWTQLNIDMIPLDKFVLYCILACAGFPRLRQ